MKRIFLIFSVLLICLLAIPSFARDGRGGPKDRVWRSMTAAPVATDDATLGYRIGDEWHYGGRFWVLTDTTIGTAVWAEQVSSGASVYVSSLIVDGSLKAASAGVTLTQTQATLPIKQIFQGTSAGVIGSAVYDSSGATKESLDQAGNKYIDGSQTVKGNSLANEFLGGTSTYVITGNLDMTTLASATAALLTAGRIIELNAAFGVSQVIRLSDMNSLSSVTNDMLFVDITLAGNPSGVTVWSPTNKLVSGLGATFTTGDTIFINGGASGNTGYTLTCKALNYGSGVTPSWRVWTDADVIRRP